MTTENTKVDDTKQVDGGQQPSVEDLQAQLATANAEAAKERNIRKTLQAERDAAKKQKPAEKHEDDFKSLYAEANEKNEKLLARQKTSAIESAVKGRLVKAGVLPDAIDAATR